MNIQFSVLRIFCARRKNPIWSSQHKQRRYFESPRSKSQSSELASDLFDDTDKFAQPTWGLVPDKDTRTDNFSDDSTEAGEFTSSWGLENISSSVDLFDEEVKTDVLPVSEFDHSESLEHMKLVESASISREHQKLVRKIKLPPFPGPESSRAGRPMPKRWPSITKTYNTVDKNKISVNHNRDNKESKSKVEWHVSQSISSKIHYKQNWDRLQTRVISPEPQWNLLKKRTTSLSYPLEATSQRELRNENAKIFSYTPISSNSAYKDPRSQSTDNSEFSQDSCIEKTNKSSRSSSNPQNWFKQPGINPVANYVMGKRVESPKTERNLKLNDTSGQVRASMREKVSHQALYSYEPLESIEVTHPIDKVHEAKKTRNIRVDCYDQLSSKIPLSKPKIIDYEKSKLYKLDQSGEEKFSDVINTNDLSIKSESSSLKEDQLTLMPSLNLFDSLYQVKSLNKIEVAQPEQTLNDEQEIEKERSKCKKEKKKRGQKIKPIYDDVKDKLVHKARDRARRESKFARDQEEEEKVRLHLEEKIERQRLKAERKAARKAAPTPILLPHFISVANLATAMKVRYEDLATKMEVLGFQDTHSDVILNAENSGLIAMEYNFEAIPDFAEDVDLKPRNPHPNQSELTQRPPIVTIMGHVDHGKTTLLDYLRKSSIAASEHGGITQHIGAFLVRMPGGKMVTFLDTPGHEAFLNMRQRGACITDIIILVVAADDGVKPQTLEAIKHAKSANVPIIVAISKIDKPDIDIDKVKLQLAQHGVEIEDFGGDTQVVCVSGSTGEGMDKFEETILALAEILDTRAEIDGLVEGLVLETSVLSLGKVATVLVRRGTLCPGQILVAGTTWTRVRILRNEVGIEIAEARPGTPVVVDGWREQPTAGDEVLQAQNEIKAKCAVNYRIEKKNRKKLAVDMEAINSTREENRRQRALAKATLEAAIEKDENENSEALPVVTRESEIKPKGPKVVYFIVKGDVSGSVEAVTDQISLLKTKEIQAVILRSGVGKITKFDIEHAAAAKGSVINFNLPVDPEIYRLAEDTKVQILENNIIYALVDTIRMELSKYLPPLVSYIVLGEAEIAQIIFVNIKGRKMQPIAGCKVRNGLIKKNGRVRVVRNGQKIFDGELSSLRIVKKKVLEVSKGNECGMSFMDGWSEFQVGDQVQHYEEKYEKRYLIDHNLILTPKVTRVVSPLNRSNFSSFFGRAKPEKFEIQRQFVLYSEGQRQSIQSNSGSKALKVEKKLFPGWAGRLPSRSRNQRVICK